MLHAAKFRKEFGRSPERAYFDPNEDWKLRHKAQPEFNILGNWDDLMQVYYWVISTHFMLRGSLEVRFICCFPSTHYVLTAYFCLIALLDTHFKAVRTSIVRLGIVCEGQGPV